MINLWEYDSRKLDSILPQMMVELERIGNEGWELILIRNDIDEEGKLTAIFKRRKETETIAL